MLIKNSETKWLRFSTSLWRHECVVTQFSLQSQPLSAGSQFVCVLGPVSLTSLRFIESFYIILHLSTSPSTVHSTSSYNSHQFPQHIFHLFKFTTFNSHNIFISTSEHLFYNILYFYTLSTSPTPWFSTSPVHCYFLLRSTFYCSAGL